ncbi:MAG: hypothetical protein ABIR06_05040 [Cyclobacteriaceae bacterium]
MKKRTSLIKALSTQSNSAGILIMMGVALTNDAELDADKIANYYKFEDYHSPYEATDFELFAPLENRSLSLTGANRSFSDEQVILDFANKLLASQKELDQDIKKALRHGRWDLL